MAIISGLAGTVAAQNSQGGVSDALLLDHSYVDGLFGRTLSGYIMVIIGGIALMTNEFRFNTATGTFLGQPRRIDVVKAKLAAGAILGLIVMAISVVTGMVATYLGLLPYKHVGPDFSSILMILWSAILIGALLGVMGVSIGTLIRNNQLASTGTLLYLYVVERLLVVFAPHIAKYLITGLITSLMSLPQNLKIGDSFGQINPQDFLSAFPASVLLIIYALAIAALAVRTTLRRDI